MIAIASSLRSQRNDKLSRRALDPAAEDQSENNVFIKKYLDQSSNNGEADASECSLTEASSFGASASSLGASLSDFSNAGTLIREVPPVKIDKTPRRNRGLYRSRSSRLHGGESRRSGLTRNLSGRSLKVDNVNNKPKKVSKKKKDELSSTSAHVVSGNTNKHAPSSKSKRNKERSPSSSSSTGPVTHVAPVNRRVQRSYSTQSLLNDRSKSEDDTELKAPTSRKPMKKAKSDELGGSAHVIGSASMFSGVTSATRSPRAKSKKAATLAAPGSPQKKNESEHTPFVSPKSNNKSPRKARLSKTLSTRNVAGEVKGGFLVEPPVVRPSRAAAAAIVAPGKKSKLVRPTRSVSPTVEQDNATPQEALQKRILRRTKSWQELGERTEDTYYEILKEHNDSAHVEREVRESSDYGNIQVKLNKDKLKAKGPSSRASGLAHFISTSNRALEDYDAMLQETNDSAHAKNRNSSHRKPHKFSDMTI